MSIRLLLIGNSLLKSLYRLWSMIGPRVESIVGAMSERERRREFQEAPLTEGLEAFLLIARPAAAAVVVVVSNQIQNAE